MQIRKRDEIEAKEGRDIARMAQQGASSLLYSVMIVAAVLIGIVLSSKINAEWDLSRAGENRLSPQTVSVLENLDRDVKLYALYSRRDPRVYENYWNLLHRFAKASDRVEFEFVDPVANPGIIARLRLDPERDRIGRGGVTAAAAGDRVVTFRGDEEQDVTNALLEVARTEQLIVGFIRGYGEKDPTSDGNSGLVGAVNTLRREYYDVREVSLATDIPTDVTTLIIAGPKLRIPPDDLERLSRWLKRGGRLLALLEPDDASGLNEVLDQWGLSNDGVQVYDPTSNINNSQVFLKITQYSNHEVVRGFGENYPVAFPVAGGVSHYESGDPEVFHTDLAFTGVRSFGLGADGSRQSGPISVAAAAWKQGQVGGEEVATRVIVVGDSDFATRAYIPAQANRNFFLNCVGWLCRQTELVSIRRNELAGQKIELEASEFAVLYLVFLTAPALTLIVGVVVYVRRRGL